MTTTATTPARGAAKKAAANAPAKATPKVTDDKTAKMSEARNAAQSTLNAKYRTELNALIQSEAKARGIDWKPKPTEAEKKRAALLELLADPDLAQVAREVTEAQATPEIEWDAAAPEVSS